MANVIDELKNGSKRAIIGKLPPGIAQKFGLENCSENIVMWSDRLEHIEKHRDEYDDDEHYELHLNSIPYIV